MYQKVSDGGKTFEHGGIVDTNEEIVEGINPEGMTFIFCPQCRADVFPPCNCFPPNFTCSNCDWFFSNHFHKKNSDYPQDVSQKSLISGSIRK